MDLLLLDGEYFVSVKTVFPLGKWQYCCFVRLPKLLLGNKKYCVYVCCLNAFSLAHPKVNPAIAYYYEWMMSWFSNLVFRFLTINCVLATVKVSHDCGLVLSLFHTIWAKLRFIYCLLPFMGQKACSLNDGLSWDLLKCGASKYWCIPITRLVRAIYKYSFILECTV